MKIGTLLLVVLLLAAVGGGAYFYIYIHTPMMTENQRLSQGMPELAKAKAELKKYKEREAVESAWVPMTVETIRSGLTSEIAAGKVEVATGGSRIVVNITEQTLYQAGSKTFAKDSPNTLMKIASLLKAKDLEGREILVGNTTSSVAAAGKGRRRTPAKDGRVLAGERSLELVKYFEKNGVNAASLAAVAYAPKMADKGFKIKEKKTVIVIGAMPVPVQEAAAPAPAAAAPAQQPKPAAVAPAPAQAAPKAAPATIPQQTVPVQPQPVAPQPVQPQQIQPKPVPVQPAQPKSMPVPPPSR